MNIRPLQDRIIIEQHEAPEKTPGGIILAPTTQEKPCEGTVVAVGPGRYLETGTTRRKPEVETGVSVLYQKYAGTEVEVDGKKYVILREDDVLAILPPREKGLSGH